MVLLVLRLSSYAKISKVNGRQHFEAFTSHLSTDFETLFNKFYLTLALNIFGILRVH